MAVPGPTATTTPLASRLYGALVAVLALAAVASETVPNRTLVVAVGAIGVVTLLAASRRVRARPALAWAAAHRDPFPLFALGAALLVAAVLAPGPEVSAAGLAPADGLVALAAGFAAAGFLVMIREATPRRALDSLFMCAIGAAAIGFVGWVLVLRTTDTSAVGLLAAFVIPVLDLCVVGLALVVLCQRTSGRRGATLLLLSWLVVLASHLGEMVGVLRGAELTGGEAAPLTLVALGLLGVAAFDPATSRVPEPRLQPLRPLPAVQVVVSSPRSCSGRRWLRCTSTGATRCPRSSSSAGSCRASSSSTSCTSCRGGPCSSTAPTTTS